MTLAGSFARLFTKHIEENKNDLCSLLRRKVDGQDVPLEEIVRALEQGKGRLEDAIRNYERGAALKAHCERKLAEAEARIEQITLGAGGTPAAQPARFE